jgi:Domain of unknown function (DUF1905)
MEYVFSSELWVWPGQAAWHFITVPKEISDEIKLITAGNTHGFGSVKVTAKISDVTWQTSMFPDSNSQCFLMPIKKEIRNKTHIVAGDTIDITLQIL